MRYPSALPSNTANTSLIFSLAFNLYDFINSHEFWNSSLPQQNSVIFCFVFFVIVLSYSDLQMCMNVNYLYHNWSLWSLVLWLWVFPITIHLANMFTWCWKMRFYKGRDPLKKTFSFGHCPNNWGGGSTHARIFWPSF